MKAAYYDEDDLLQVSAIFAMGRNADSRWVPSVLEELDNPNPSIRFEAARACGELEIIDVLPKLINLLQNEFDIEVQEVAIGALGQIGGPVAQEALEECLEWDTEAIVIAASDALEELAVFDESLRLFDMNEMNKYTNKDEWEH
ncbi:HEAT repeat domain-containing protein [Anaerolineales bacterium HSG24]|nr:HEAT repeat domain-containing protein [Anaerolineales bacterium HSG24]